MEKKINQKQIAFLEASKTSAKMQSLSREEKPGFLITTFFPGGGGEKMYPGHSLELIQLLMCRTRYWICNQDTKLSPVSHPAINGFLATIEDYFFSNSPEGGNQFSSIVYTKTDGLPGHGKRKSCRYWEQQAI
jgi:hypothetical protein